ncbi:MAG: glycoside hydrolase family 2 TIM barrel-domain containing protein [Ferruginibacter sp.]|nr:glycoside hydrolase family 2 TIM barrel-domain containing protein [Ferruginibacter sp.]
MFDLSKQIALKNILLLFALCISSAYLAAQETVIQYLSGTDKDHTVPWEFNCTKGRNSGKWTTIAVPSNWEQQGFGGYSYGHDKVKTEEEGLYRHNFTIDQRWSQKKVFIVFEGSMTDTEVKINGQQVGPVHQGGFYRFKYDISSFLKYGARNLLEVKVSKQSTNASINRAERGGDFWALGGIFRPVYLELLPETFIDRVAINATADGMLKLHVFAGNARKGDMVSAQLQTLAGKNIEGSFGLPLNTTGPETRLQRKFNKPALWNPETPNLYQLKITIQNGANQVHTGTQRLGFRTAELRLNDGFYVNGTRVIFKGVNRHSSWPLTGRTLSKAISIQDVQLMKEMNMNAVRMSHYPPDQHFLDVCDSLGLFVLDELTGWQAAYDTVAGRPLVKELVIRDVNHPSVVMWANGNEGGWNRALDNDFKLYDPQERLVYHPWEKFNGTDTKHYPDFTYVVNSALYNKEVYFPTEFMHGLYDGGHGAGLDDFWNGILAHPHGTGGFLWSFSDEGVVRMDKDSIIDTDGNHAPDGIVGPYREKEASFYTIKEIWSPVHVKQQFISPGFNGQLDIENRYLYTNLDQCKFQWRLTRLALPGAPDIKPVSNITGTPPRFSLAPGETGKLALGLPAGWQDYDVLYVTAYDRTNKELFTWSWPLDQQRKVARFFPVAQKAAGEVTAMADGTQLIVTTGNLQYYFDTISGMLSKVMKGNTTISLSKGPLVNGIKYNLKAFKHYRQGPEYVVEPVYEGESFVAIRWTFTAGRPARLDYSYNKRGEAPVLGLSFNYPEEKITGMKWLGRGPYRVWKNRLKGQQFGVWQKAYNNTITGESWKYPEFKGFHADMRWVVVENKEAAFTVFFEGAAFLQMLKPARPVGSVNDNTDPPYAEGNLGFLDAISPIGTKFQAANKLGPQSQLNMQLNYGAIKGTLWFDFR